MLSYNDLCFMNDENKIKNFRRKNEHHIIIKQKQKKMKNKTKETVTEFLTAVQQGNTEKIGALLHPEIEWNQPGNNQLSGIKRSNKEVFDMVGRMFEISANTLRLTDFKELSTNGNNVACLLHWNATHTSGSNLDIDNIDVYTVKDGKIIKAEIFTTDEGSEDLFWGN